MHGPSCLLVTPCGKLVVQFPGVAGRKVRAAHSLCNAVVLRSNKGVTRHTMVGMVNTVVRQRARPGWRCAVVTPSGELISAGDCWRGLELWC